LRFIVVGGFLGSGKTSLISALAGAYAGTGQSVVVLENEAGRAGLDSELLASQGIKVERMLGGCACCDLLPMLMTKMKDLETQGETQVVLFEPSGVASLENLLADLAKYASESISLGVVVVMDSSRFDVMREAMANLLRGQLNATRLLVLSKIDLITPAESAEVQTQLRDSSPGLSIWPVNLTSSQNEEMAADLVRVLENTKVDVSLLLSQDSPYQAYFWDLDIAAPGLEPEQAVTLLAELLAITGQGAGGASRGLAHVKLLGHDAGGQMLFASGTTEADLGLRGHAKGPIQGRALCEVIAFGAPSEELEQSLKQAIAGQQLVSLT
jgi:Ni2+-binding GTPase involved in maturation of urease and hydrogenase